MPIPPIRIHIPEPSTSFVLVATDESNRALVESFFVLYDYDDTPLALNRPSTGELIPYTAADADGYLSFVGSAEEFSVNTYDPEPTHSQDQGDDPIWQPGQTFRDALSRLDTLPAAEILDLCEIEGIDYGISRRTYPVHNARPADDPTITLARVVLHWPHPDPAHSGWTAAAEGIGLARVVSDALTRLNIVRRGLDQPLTHGRCPRCGAPVAVNSIKRGILACSECPWTTTKPTIFRHPGAPDLDFPSDRSTASPSSSSPAS